MPSRRVNFAEADKVVEEWFEKWMNDSLSFADIDKVLTSWTSKIKDPEMASSRHEDFIFMLDKFLFYGYSSDWIKQIVKSEEFTTCHRASSFNYQPFYFKCTMCEDSGVIRTLCAECYENSEHRTHNYTMSRIRSGYCCCGEHGTWEKTWYCTKHQNKEKLNVLPEDVESRARIVIEAIVVYAEDLLNCYKNIDQNEDGNDDECRLALYTNSAFQLKDFRRLINYMIPSITNEDFFTYSQKLTQDGRIYMKLPKRDCKHIDAKLRRKNSKYMTMILSDDSVIRLEFIVSLLSYLQKCLTYGDKFREIFCKSILTPLLHSNQCFAENFLIHSWNLPKPIRNTFLELIIFGVMKKYETKKCLAKMIMAKYDVIIHRIDTKPVKAVDFINGINGQLFSIPALAHYFITQENALSVGFTGFLKDTQKAYEEFEKNSENAEERFECAEQTFNPTSYHMNFVESLLETLPNILSEELRVGFLNGLTCFLRVLSTFQGIAPSLRNTDKREEYEKDDWPQYFISYCLFRFIQLILPWCGSYDEVLGVACEKTFNMINKRIGCETDRSEKTVSLLSYSIQCLPYDSTIHPVSIYLPLYRFFVRLSMMQLRKHDSLDTTALPAIFDSVLKINAMLAQVLAGMWKLEENFIEILTEDYYMENRIIRFESDIQLSQIVASTTEPNEFLIKVLEKYGLIDWAEDHFTTRKDDEMEQVIRISEQFLKFLITMLTERYLPGVGFVTSQDYLQQDVIHCLCIKPSSRLEIKKFLGLVPDCDTAIDNAIEEVAVSKSVCAGETPIFELKKEFFDRFNALYYHYDQQNLSNANEFQRQRRKAAREPDCFPPPQLPKLKQFFHPIVGIFHCDVMLHVMRTVLVRFLDFEAKCSSETQIQNVLYLIGHALQEEKSGYYPNLCFTKKAVEWKLLDYLEELLRSNRDDLPKALLQWTIRKFNEVINPTAEVSLTLSASDEQEKLKRSQMIAAKRDRIMKNMIEMQKQFVEKNPVNDEEQTINQPKLEKTCILCQGTDRIDFENENVLVMPGFVQYSTVLCGDRGNISDDDGYFLLSSNLGPAFYTSSCGHVMHAKCLNDSHSFELDTSDPEFFCPLCDTFSNTMLPVIPPSSSFKKPQSHISSQLREASVEFMDQFQKLPNSNSLQVWKSLSYTVHVVETILRDSNKPILGHLSSHHQECLEGFIKISEAANHFYSSDALYKSNIRKLRSFLTLKNPKEKETIQFDSLLRFDIFSLYVAVVFSEIAVIHGENYNLMIFVAQIIQILITTNFDEMVDDDVEDEDETPFKSILRLSGKNLDHLSEKFVWNYIQKSCIPFLRCCVLFYSFLNDGPSPIELTELNCDTFTNMCSYLGFPQTREELFHKKEVSCLVQNWLKHPDVKKRHEFSRRNPNYVNQLTELPHTYLELIKKTAVFKCVRSFNKLPTEVHICLVCGEMLCTGICCEVFVEGEALSPLDKHNHKTHTNLKTCGSDLYLDVYKNTIVFRPSAEEVGISCLAGPYGYGKTDASRSSPTFLSLQKYKELHTSMLNHNIFEKVMRNFRNEMLTD